MSPMMNFKGMTYIPFFTTQGKKGWRREILIFMRGTKDIHVGLATLLGARVTWPKVILNKSRLFPENMSE